MNSISICAHMIAGIVIHQTNITILEHIPLRISATACQSNKMHATGTSVSHAYNMVKKEKEREEGSLARRGSIECTPAMDCTTVLNLLHYVPFANDKHKECKRKRAWMEVRGSSIPNNALAFQFHKLFLYYGFLISPW